MSLGDGLEVSPGVVGAGVVGVAVGLVVGLEVGAGVGKMQSMLIVMVSPELQFSVGLGETREA